MAKLGNYRDAATTLEHGRARILSEKLQRYKLDLEALSNTEPDLAARLDQTLQGLRFIDVEEANRTDVVFLSNRRQVLSESLNLLIQEVRKISGFEKFLQLFSFEDIQECLAQGEVAIYLTTTEKGSLLIAVTSNNCDAVFSSFHRQQLEQLLIERDGQEVIGGYLPGQEKRDWLQASLIRMLPIIGKELIQPLGSRLDSSTVNHIFLVPDGLLSLLPLHAASWVANHLTISLLDQYAVSYEPSIQILRQLKEGLSKHLDQPTHLLGIANPMPNSEPLTHAKSEVEAVKSFFPKESISIFFRGVCH